MEEKQDRKVILRLQNISKEYRLGQIGYGTLNKDLQSWWARVRKKPDPNLKLGKEQRLYGDTILALRDINLTVRQGERIGIIGGNGAGKSTLLKLISRVTVPTTGSLDLYGRVTSMLEVGTGFHGEMTGKENIYLNGSILGMSSREIDQKLEKIIEFSEVRDFIDTPVKRYSSGMYVKLAFAVAAHLDSEIIIMDEVLAVGDEAFQKKCIRKMREVAAEENRTVLYVSHNMKTVRELCQKCIVLSEGRIVFEGETEDAIGYYRDFLKSSNPSSRNIGGIVRRSSDLSGLCRITDLTIVNHQLSGSEPLRFTLRLQAEKPVKNAAIRLIICNGIGQILGMTCSDFFDLSQGENLRLFSLPTECLGTGNYISDLVLFSYNRNIQTRHDFLSKVLPFEVVRSELFFGKKWASRNWGNIVFPAVRTQIPEDEDL